MPIVRIIVCNVCGEKKEEDIQHSPNGNMSMGFKGWGSLKGKMNDETGETECFLCPRCLDEVTNFINGMGV
jgi:hypothetical protein